MTQTAMERLQKEFNRKHAGTAVAGWIACAAALMPTIAPFLGKLAPFALVAKYAWDKIDERTARSALSKSMMGVITTTHDNSK